MSLPPDAPSGWPECDGAAVGVDELHVGVVLLLPRQHDRGERLVDLDGVDVVQRELGPLEHAGRGRDGPGEHRHRVDTGQGEGVEAGPRPQAQCVRLLLAHDEHGGGAVGDLRGVPRRDLAVLLEGGLELGQRLDRGVGADALVGGEDLVGVLALVVADGTGTISFSKRPSAVAVAARWWLRTEKASSSSREMPHWSAIISAPMPWPFSRRPVFSV